MKSTLRQAIRIAPGEPVPPGFEGEVKPVAELQPALDKCMTKALVGIEYIIELSTLEGKIPCYHCVLCDRSYYRKYEPKSIMVHLLSDAHRTEFLNRHFATAMKEIHKYRAQDAAKGILSGIIDAICSAIEDTYGRMVPQIIEHNNYIDNRKLFTKKVYDEAHFDEKLGSKFTEMIDHDAILRQLNRDIPKKDTKSSSTSKTSSTSKPSSSSSTSKPSSSTSTSKSSSNSKTSSTDKSERTKDSKDLPKSNDKLSSSSKSEKKHNELVDKKNESSKERVIVDVELARKQYRFMLESAMRDIKDRYVRYDKYPEKHPKYPAEWKIFWNRRSEEMRAENKDPSKHNFSTEWSLYWVDFVKDLHADEVIDAKIDIKKQLNLPLDFDEEPVKEKKKSVTEKTVEKKNVPEPEPVPAPKPIPPELEIMAELVSESELNDTINDDDVDIISSDAESIIAGLQMEGTLDKYKLSDKEEREDITPDKDIINMDRISEESFHIHERIENESAKVIDSDDDFDSYEHRHSHHKPITKAPSLIQISDDESNESEPDEESLTLIAVLRILTAFEDYLGSLGPKILDLLSKAIALEKVKPNLADEMLMTEPNSVLLELCKEKLTGLLLAEIIERHKIKGVKKAMRNIKAIVKTIDRKVQEKQEAEKLHAAVSSLKTVPKISDEHFENLRKLLPTIIPSTSSTGNSSQSSTGQKNIFDSGGQFNSFTEMPSFSKSVSSNYNNEQSSYHNSQQHMQTNSDLKSAQSKLNLEFSFLNPQNSSRNITATTGGGTNFPLNRSQNKPSMNNMYPSPNYMNSQQNNQPQSQFQPKQQQQFDVHQKPNQQAPFNQQRQSFAQSQQMASYDQNQSSYYNPNSDGSVTQNQEHSQPTWNQNRNNFQQNQNRNIQMQQNNARKRPPYSNVNQCHDNYKKPKMTSSMDMIGSVQEKPHTQQMSNPVQNRPQPQRGQQMEQQFQPRQQQNPSRVQQNPPRNQQNPPGHQQQKQQQRNQPHQHNQQRNQSSQQMRNQSSQQQQRNQQQKPPGNFTQPQRNQQNQQSQQQRNQRSFQNPQDRQSNQQNNWQQHGGTLFKQF